MSLPVGTAVGPAGPPRSGEVEALRTSGRLREVARDLGERFLGRDEVIRLLLVSLIAGEHLLLVGPPGTAKSALVRHLARLVDARYFEYLLTRFSEPNEIFGPVDIKAFREGLYLRRTESMLPDAEIAFLDEIFKSNSAILNSLLSLLNERRFFTGSERRRVPLCSLFAATNEVPNDEALGALFDRFLVRAIADNLDSYQFQTLLVRGVRNEVAELSGTDDLVRPMVSLAEITGLRRRLDALMPPPDDFLARYKTLVFQIRGEGITLSDRRAVKMLKLFAASAVLDGRSVVNDGDLFVLKHVWNSVDQVALLGDLVNPVLERHLREHPGEQRPAAPADLDALLVELGNIRSLLLGGESLSDVQLFSQLRNLQDIRAALERLGSETAMRMIGEVDRLLDGVFESARWTG